MSLWADAEAIRRFLAARNLPDAIPQPVAREGVANAVWICGDLVVRVSKDPEYADDAYVERIAHPLAERVSDKVPKWVDFDASGEFFTGPVSVIARAAGTNLSTAWVSDPQAFFVELALEMKKFHTQVEVPPGRELDPPWLLERSELLKLPVPDPVREQIEHMELNPPAGFSFVHQDLHPDNLMVNEGHLSAILDWGDAALGDPAADFRYIPAAFLMEALEAYGNPSLADRAKAHVLDQFFYANRNGLDYGPYGNSSLPAVLRLFQ